LCPYWHNPFLFEFSRQRSFFLRQATGHLVFLAQPLQCPLPGLRGFPRTSPSLYLPGSTEARPPKANFLLIRIQITFSLSRPLTLKASSFSPQDCLKVPPLPPKLLLFRVQDSGFWNYASCMTRQTPTCLGCKSEGKDLHLPYPTGGGGAWEKPREAPGPRGRSGQGRFAERHTDAQNHASAQVDRAGSPPPPAASHLLPRTGSPRPE
jgi:hypothetical protein